MYENIYYRPHKAGLARQCPSSLLCSPDIKIRSEAGLPAILGRAGHYTYENYISQGVVIEPHVINEIAIKFAVDVNGFNGLGWRVYKLQDKHRRLVEKKMINQLIVERPIPVRLENGYEYTSIPDAIEAFGSWGIVVEVKMGIIDTGWMEQGLSYCLSMLKQFGDTGMGKFYVVLMAPILDYYEVKSFTTEQVLEYEQFIIGQIDKAGKEYCRGDKCQYCPNLLHCQAVGDDIDLYSKDFIETKGRGQIDLAKIAQWRPIMKAMKKIYETYDKAEKVLLNQCGTIDLGNGKELFLRDEARRKYDVSKTIPIMVDEFHVEREDFVKKLEISSESIKELSDAVAPPKGKGKQLQAIKDRFKAEDAYTETVIQKRAEREILVPPQLTEGESV